jgi:hypothetical protein
MPQVTGGQPQRVRQQARQRPTLGTLKHLRPKTGSVMHHRPPPIRTQGVQALACGATPPPSLKATAALEMLDR